MNATRRVFASLAVGVALALTFSGSALANGVGDLYVASPGGVVEVYVEGSQVVSTVPLVPAPTALAFSPDGKWLFTANDGAHITAVEIETLEPGEPVAVPGEVTALAFPSGQLLVGAMPARRSLVFVGSGATAGTESDQLPGPGNLIAGDRHDPRVAVAEAGKSWLAIVDPATNAIATTTLGGEIHALAIDRDRGAVLVATKSPDAIVDVDLTSHAVLWTATLGEAPTFVAPLAQGAIAASGAVIWRVSADGATKWATAGGTITGISVSDEGTVVHVARADAVEVFDKSAKLARTIELSGAKAPRAMAAVPAGSSLFTNKGNNAALKSAAPTPRSASGTGAPVTSLTEDVERLVAEPQLQTAAVVALAILMLCWLAIHWYEARHRERARHGAR